MRANFETFVAAASPRRRLRGLPGPAGLVALAMLTLPPVARADAPHVTLYTQDLGFVRETRGYDRAGARDTVRFDGVSERLDFSSVRVAPADGSKVSRLAFRYDVASGDALVDKARGTRVSVVSRGDRTTEGTLIASDGSWLVVRAADGSIQTLSRAAVESVRLANPPAGLSLRPTLEAVFEGGRRGHGEAELSYLTGGLSWSAEHVLVRRGETGGQWTSRVTVDNRTGRDYVDARVKLVAGQPSRVGGGPSPVPMPMMAMRTSAADGGMEKSQMSESGFAEYHLYTLDAPATLRDQETQSLVMYDTRDVKYTPRYLYRGGDPNGVRTQLEFVNEKANGLGMPIPAGRVRVFQSDDAGDLQFTGESSIGHQAAGEKFTVDVGRAFDLVAERKLTSSKRIADRETESSFEIKLRNRKSVAVTIVVEEGVGGDSEVTQKSHPFERKDANTLQWKIPVPAGKEVVLTYTVRTRF